MLFKRSISQHAIRLRAVSVCGGRLYCRVSCLKMIEVGFGVRQSPEEQSCHMSIPNDVESMYDLVHTAIISGAVRALLACSPPTSIYILHHTKSLAKAQLLHNCFFLCFAVAFLFL